RGRNMEARIVGFKRSRRDVNNKYCILEGNTSPASLIGKTVRWQTQSGGFLSGNVIRTHGSRGVLVRFSSGLPGTAIGSRVIVGRVEVGKAVPKKRPKTSKKVEPKAKKKAKSKTVKKPEKKRKTSKKIVKKTETKAKGKAKKKTPTKKGKSKTKSRRKK
ncbi:MAG: 50S ribosomal protein L35ae, partial [Candidatus Hydrothermarchaeaceae archaeon]